MLVEELRKLVKNHGIEKPYDLYLAGKLPADAWINTDKATYLKLEDGVFVIPRKASGTVDWIKMRLLSKARCASLLHSMLASVGSLHPVHAELVTSVFA